MESVYFSKAYDTQRCEPQDLLSEQYKEQLLSRLQLCLVFI